MKWFLLTLLLAPGILFGAPPRQLTIDDLGSVSPKVGRGEVVKVHGAMGATATFSMKDGNRHSAIVDQACTISFTTSAWPISGEEGWIRVVFYQNGGFQLTMPAGVTGNFKLDPIAAHLTVLTFVTMDHGTTITVTSSYDASIPVVSKSANYTLTAAEVGGQVVHPAADNNARTWTIDSNANLPLDPGATYTFVNLAVANLTIAITTDTMYLMGPGTTGSRTLAQFNVCTANKVAATTWVITGSSGLTWRAILPNLPWYV